MILKVGKEKWVNNDPVEYELTGAEWRCTLKMYDLTPDPDTSVVRGRPFHTEAQGVGTGASPTEAFDQAVQDVLDKINGLREQRLATR